MLAILGDARTGELQTCEVPPPELRAGGILVRTSYSAISSGTERATVETSEKSLFGKAMARPDLVRQVIDFARKNGLKAAYDKVQSRLENLIALGYSSAGIVLAVGDGVHEFQPGDRVACAGGGYASHAEINFVPRNLAVHVPDSVSLKHAALTTIGSIAMQGVRQGNVSLGETVVVIGAGLVGVLAIQIARAAGCRVVAIDVNPGRTARAVELGAHLGVQATDPRAVEKIREFSTYGADVAIVTAAVKSSEPTEMAAKVLRDRGRIVIVGDVGLGVSRPPMYMKELSLVLSRSYGPGRYDANYEERGSDYPIGYVRWTEQRNMEAFVGMLAAGSVNVEPLVGKMYPVEQGAKAYAEVRSGSVYTSILQYPARTQERMICAKTTPRTAHSATDKLRVGCIGAGGFARDIIFPNLRASSDVVLRSVATASGASAESARRGFKFELCQTPDDLLSDPQNDAAFVISHHDSHAQYVLGAIDNRKQVFVEKPLAATREELERIQRAYSEAVEGNKPAHVMVGFNRRFAPMTEKIRRFFGSRQEPMMVHIRVNAGYIPRDHWTQVEGCGGRIVGEFCHFVDWARSVVQSPIRTVWATALPNGSKYNRDNISAVLTFVDGSIANVLYLANGDNKVNKEFYEVFCEGGIARLDDFVSLELVRNRKSEMSKGARDKGHKAEIALTIEAMRNGREAPIGFDQLVEVTEATFAIHDSISTGLPVSIGAGLATMGAGRRNANCR